MDSNSTIPVDVPFSDVFLEAQRVDDALQSFASGLASPNGFSETKSMLSGPIVGQFDDFGSQQQQKQYQYPLTQHYTNATTTQRASSHISPQIRAFFNQTDDHEDFQQSPDDCRAEHKSEITSTFLDAFFRFPSSTPEAYEVDYDLFLFLYENVVPRKCRQRPQEVAKIRIKKLESVLPRPEASDNPSEKKLAKRTWAHQRHKKVVLQGIIGPEFYASTTEFQNLCALVGRNMSFDAASFQALWEASKPFLETIQEPKQKKRKLVEDGAASNTVPPTPGVISVDPSSNGLHAPPMIATDLIQPLQVPYDVFDSSPSTIQMIFDIPGVYETPMFSLNKRAGLFRLEGFKAPPPVYLSQPMYERQRWSGTFQVTGPIPPQVDLQVPPLMKMEAGQFIATFSKLMGQPLPMSSDGLDSLSMTPISSPPL